MVFYFLSTVCDPPTVLFMGRDKHENEDLIKHGWPEDVWFHVDKVTAAEKMRVREGEAKYFHCRSPRLTSTSAWHQDRP